MRLLRTIRFDPSDSHVFETAAPERDWAVAGTFAFANLDRSAITGKTRQAFANGWLGLPSFGHSTFVTVAEATEADHYLIVDTLAQHFVDRYGAPSLADAIPVARDELAYVIDLCAGAAPGTVFAMGRDHDEDGEIRETVRTIPRPGSCGASKVWDILEDS
ncbi:MAG: DUF6505 family protein [Pseudomonadota bacterium]